MIVGDFKCPKCGKEMLQMDGELVFCDMCRIAFPATHYEAFCRIFKAGDAPVFENADGNGEEDAGNA